MVGLTNIVGTGVVLFGFGLFSPSAARADETPPRDESSYSSLVDEPSRDELFQQEVIPAAMAEVAAEAKATLRVKTSPISHCRRRSRFRTTL